MCAFSALSALALVAGCFSDDRPHSDVSALPQSPTGVLDLNDQPFDLWRANSSSATVVVFIRSDCPISNRFAPEINRLVKLYQPRGVVFYLVYVDPTETADAIRRHLK